MKTRLLLLCLFLMVETDFLPAQDPVQIKLGSPASQPFRGTTQIGLNMEMALTSEEMWKAGDHWMARTFTTA